jgi:hypothetical protein
MGVVELLVRLYFFAVLQHERCGRDEEYQDIPTKVSYGYDE